jgi:uncharacterized protein (DUF1800 family)
MENSEAHLKTGVQSINPITGKLGFNKAKHLLNRCMFGANKTEIEFMQDKTIDEALHFLLLPPSEPLAPPLGYSLKDKEIPVGTTWVNTKFNRRYKNQRKTSYTCWWIGRIFNQDLSLQEKMVLFWHNHFVIETDIVRNTNYHYLYNKLLLKHALGNFKTFVKEMTVNVGMLKYLDGDHNKVGAPNENYARELFELFTIGKGPLLDEGNYTNYTEHDIREAAKVLTGWKTDDDNDTSYFSKYRHDKSKKNFSHIFENYTITNKGEEEYKQLIDMIFMKKETARYIVRKLYRWFVYSNIDKEIEQQIIEPLATIFFNNNYEIKPLLKTLLSSEHFFDENYRGCMIKNPLEFTIGILRQLEFPLPKGDNTTELYYFWSWIYYRSKTQNLEIGDPPDVAGWPAWYLEPNFNELWINSASIPNRAKVINYAVAWGIRPRKGYDKIYLDHIGLATKLAADPSNINILIPAFTNLLFPKQVSDKQITEFKNILIPGLPDSEWTTEWNRYINNPDDANQKKAVAKSLRKLIWKMCSMAEYQLI